MIFNALHGAVRIILNGLDARARTLIGYCHSARSKALMMLSRCRPSAAPILITEIDVVTRSFGGRVMVFYGKIGDGFRFRLRSQTRSVSPAAV